MNDEIFTEEDISAVKRLQESAECDDKDALASQEKLEKYVNLQLHGLLKRMEECAEDEYLADFSSLRKALLRATLDRPISHEDFETKIDALLEASEIYCSAPIVASLAPVSPMIAKRLELSTAIMHLSRATAASCESFREKIGADTPQWNGGYTHSEKIQALENNRHIEPSDIEIAVSHIRGAFTEPKLFHADTFSRELVLLKYGEMTRKEIRSKFSYDIKNDTQEIRRSPAMEYMYGKYEGKVLSREEACREYEAAKAEK